MNSKSSTGPRWICFVRRVIPCGKEFSDPYVEIRAKGKIHEDVATKKKYWNPMYEQYFKTPENPDFVVLVFTAGEITYHGKNMATMEVWKR